MSGIERLNTVNIIKDLFGYNHSDSSTSYLNGIRAVGTLIIIFLHSYLFRVLVPFKNGENLQKFTTGFFYETLVLMCLVMDIFFIIGGLLTGRSLKKGLEAP